MAASRAPVRVCVVTTTPYIVNVFLQRHLKALADCYDVTLAVNTKDAYRLDAALDARVNVIHVGIERKVSPLRDIAALFGMVRAVRRGKFDVVHTVAPKAGLLGILAAWLGRVPVRIHTFQGEVWAARRGLARFVFKLADLLVGRLITHGLVVGRGEQSFLEQHGILKSGQSRVLLQGSIGGVDAARFRPDPAMRAKVRADLGIEADEIAIMYLGRIARDKGVIDLAHAFRQLDAGTHLVLVGPDEEGLSPLIEEACGKQVDRVHFMGLTSSPERYIVAGDVVCLPSYREGFGLSLVEAGACGLPVIASRLYGTQDAVIDGVTGLFHNPGDRAELEQQLRALIRDPALRERLGKAGRERAMRDFQPEQIIRAFLDYYASIVGAGRCV